MIATVPFVQKAFDRFNALCFEGELPAVPIVLTRAGSFLGKMEFKVRRGLFGKAVSCRDFRLKISTSFDLPEEELEDVVIHEMIHYFIALRMIRDTSAHGKVFRRMMESINREHGRHISVRHHGTPDSSSVRRREGGSHVLCVSTFRDGNRGVTVCASTKAPELYRQLPRYYNLKSMDWYCSTDPFFNRYPRSRTPKIYKISEGDLTEHLEGAVPLTIFEKSKSK